MPNNAKVLADLGVPPNNHLEALKGDRAAQRSIRINEIVLGKLAVTADTDLRLARYFGLSDGFWLGLQSDHDLTQRRRQIAAALRRIQPRALAA